MSLYDEKRLGIFTITTDFHTDAWDRDKSALMQIMGRCVILRAEHLVATRVIEYHAWSPDFDLVPEGLMPPRYSWVIEGEPGHEVVSAHREGE